MSCRSSSLLLLGLLISMAFQSPSAEDQTSRPEALADQKDKLTQQLRKAIADKDLAAQGELEYQLGVLIARHWFGQDSERAVSYLKASARHFNELKNFRSVVRSQMALGETFHRLGEFQQAASCYDATVALCNKLGFQNEEVHAGRMAAEERISNGDHEQAKQGLLKMVNLAGSHSTLFERQRIQYLLGLIAEEAGAYQKALDYFQSAMDHWKIQRGREHAEGVVPIQLATSSIYLKMDQPERSLEILNQSRDTCTKYNMDQLLARVYLSIGHAHRKKGDFQKALEYYKLSLEDAEKRGGLEDQLTALGSLAEVHKSLRSYDEAMAYYKRKLDLSMEMGSRTHIAASLNSMGTAYISMDKAEDAAQAYKRCLVIFKDQENRMGQIDTLYNLAYVEFNRERYDDAMKLVAQGLELVKETDGRAIWSDLLFLQGKIAKEQGDFAAAKVAYAQSLSMADKLGDESRVFRFATGLGIIQMSTRAYEEAGLQFERALKLVDKGSDKRKIAETLNRLGQVHFKQKNFETALDYQGRLLATAESLEDPVEVSRALQELGDTYAAMKDPAAASSHYSLAMGILADRSYREQLAALHWHIGGFERGQGQYLKAADHFGKASELFKESKAGEAEFQSLLDQMNCLARGPVENPRFLKHTKK